MSTVDLIHAHGLIMGLAFGILFPAGALMIRIRPFRGLVWLHAAWQTTAWLLSWAGLGIGVYFTAPRHKLIDFPYHAKIGITVICVLTLQPVSALVHHMYWKKEQKRTAFSYWHVWVGRMLLILGGINGGLGIDYANMVGGNTLYSSSEIAYIVLACLFYGAWFALDISAAVVSWRGKASRFETGHKIILPKTTPSRDMEKVRSTSEES